MIYGDIIAGLRLTVYTQTPAKARLRNDSFEQNQQTTGVCGSCLEKQTPATDEPPQYTDFLMHILSDVATLTEKCVYTTMTTWGSHPPHQHAIDLHGYYILRSFFAAMQRGGSRIYKCIRQLPQTSASYCYIMIGAVRQTPGGTPYISKDIYPPPTRGHGLLGKPTLYGFISHDERRLPMTNKTHDLDFSEIDDLDEISGDQQLAFVWCDRHRVHEWHWIDVGRVQTSKRRHTSHTEQVSR
jgi:hypothetical protein